MRRIVVVRSEHRRGLRVPVEVADDLRDGGGLHLDVGVDEQQDLAARDRGARVARRRRTAALGAGNDARAVGGRYLSARVRRPIVHDDHFEEVRGILRQRQQAPPERDGPVVHRQDHAHAGNRGDR